MLVRTHLALSAVAGSLAAGAMLVAPLRAQTSEALRKVIADQKLPAPVGDPRWRNPPTAMDAAKRGDLPGVIWNWRWGMDMTRDPQEIESVATLEMRKVTGMVRVDGQPCTLTNYRWSINYQVPGSRADWECKLPNGQTRKNIEVFNGRYAWDEDVVGAGLEPGRGNPVAKPSELNERVIRVWAGPQGAVKAAWIGRGKVTVENGKILVTYPIPSVPGATARATLDDKTRAEKIEVRDGNSIREFIYEKYSDYGPEDDKVDLILPGHWVEKRDGQTIVDLNLVMAHGANMYVVMPVPNAIQQAAR
jgi:hypothetical protein